MKALTFLFVFLFSWFAFADGTATFGITNAEFIWGVPISPTTPTDAQVLAYNSVVNQWTPVAQSGSSSSSSSGGSGLPSLANGTVWVGNSGNLPVAVTPSGDTTFGNSGAFKTIAIQGKSVSSASPGAGNFLLYNSVGSTWTPTALSGDVTASGSGGAVAIRIQGVSVGSASPTAAQYLVYNSVGTFWNPVSSSGDATFSTTGAHRVTALQGTTVASTTPTAAQFLAYNTVGTAWNPVSSSGDASFSTTGAFKVLKLQGTTVASTSPTNNYILTYNSVGTMWEPRSTVTAALINSTQVVETVVAGGTCSTTYTVDPTTGTMFNVTLNGACQLAVTNLVSGHSFTVKLTQSSTTGPTFAAAYKWASGTAPTFSTSATKYDIIACVSLDGSTLDCSAIIDVR